MKQEAIDALEEVIQVNLEAELGAESDKDVSEAHKRAMDVLNKYCEIKRYENDSKNAELEEKEHDLHKQDSKWNRIIAIAGLVVSVVITPFITMAINDHHLRTVCQLENIDSITSTGGKSLLRGMFKFNR